MTQKIRALIFLGISATLTTALPDIFNSGDVARGFGLVFIPGLVVIAIMETIKAFRK